MSESGGAGLRLVGPPRTSACGRWFRATTQDGRQRGALLLDPALLAEEGALDRAVAAITAVRRLNLPGVLRMADPVAHEASTWLITEAPATPTVAELLSTDPSRDAGLDATGAALLAGDVAQTLEVLHQAGLAHGGLGPDTVVVTAAGSGSLVEVGLRAALLGDTPDARADIAAWAALVRTLATSGPAADMLVAVADEAESRGLLAALGLLTAGAHALPGYPQRDGLTAVARSAAAVRRAASPPAPMSASAPSGAEPSTNAIGIGGAVAVGDGHGVQPPGDGSRTLLPVAAQEPVDPADQATRMGKRGVRPVRSAPAQSGKDSGTSDDAAVRLRFGPGVPASTAEQVWRGATTKPLKRRRRRLRAVLSGLLTLALVGGVVGYLWWRAQDPLVVTAAAVAPAQPPGNRCDITIDVVGTVETNGRAGTFSYQWIRSDGQTTAVLQQSVAEGAASTQVHLYWSFTGRGTLPAEATLKILTPAPLEATGAFTYACP